jgi:hypothetical protein
MLANCSSRDGDGVASGRLNIEGKRLLARGRRRRRAAADRRSMPNPLSADGIDLVQIDQIAPFKGMVVAPN